MAIDQPWNNCFPGDIDNLCIFWYRNLASLPDRFELAFADDDDCVCISGGASPVN